MIDAFGGFVKGLDILPHLLYLMIYPRTGGKPYAKQCDL